MKTIFKWLSVPICACIGGGLFKWIFSVCFDYNCGFSVSNLARTYTFGEHILLVINYILIADTLTGYVTTIIAMYFAPKHKTKVGYIILTIIIVFFLFTIIYANTQYVLKLEENIILFLTPICSIVGCFLAIKSYKEE